MTDLTVTAEGETITVLIDPELLLDRLITLLSTSLLTWDALAQAAQAERRMWFEKRRDLLDDLATSEHVQAALTHVLSVEDCTDLCNALDDAAGAAIEHRDGKPLYDPFDPDRTDVEYP